MRVLLAYAVVAWAVVQVAATALPLLHVPDRFVSYILIAAIAGFPLAAVLAWMFDLTPEGVRRTGDADLPSAPWPLAYRVAAAVLSVAIVGAGTLATIRKFNRSAAEIRSIAVLPFRNLNNDPQQQYFSDGIAEELLNELARIEGLKVVARTSSFAFRDEAELANAQSKLRVQALLTGSVQRDGERVRVNARLIDASSGEQLWANEYNRELTGFLDMQDEITRAIVRQLELKLSSAATQHGLTRNPEALDAYLAAMHKWHARGADSLREAIELFRRATSLDPRFAEAHAGEALAWAVRPLFDFTITARQASAHGHEAARRALDLDAELPEAHAALAEIALVLDLDARTAHEHATRAVARRPSFATAHQWLGEVLQVQLRLPEARSALERALELDPWSGAARNIMSYQLVLEGKIDEAVASYRETARLFPGVAATALQIMAISLVGAERYEQAMPVFDSVLPPEMRADTRNLLRGAIATRDGKLDAPERRIALETLRRLENMLPPGPLAAYSVSLREDDRAVELFARAVRSRNDPSVPYFAIFPGFNRLRTRPDFNAVLAELGAR